MAGKKDNYSPNNSGGGVGNFLYDSSTGAVLGRTCGSWFKITVFYIIFYALLSCFFYACYQIFATTLELPEQNGSPKWTQDASLIGSNPGVGFRPMPDQDKNSESTLIWYRTTNDDDVSFWSNQLSEFVSKSKPPEGATNVIPCSLADGTGGHRVCRIPTDNLGECREDNKFGYPAGKPCVLIKLNKIFGWEPEPFGVNDGKYDADGLKKELEELVNQENGMPTDLREHILQQVAANKGQEVEILKTVWISCGGENVGDQENLPLGNIRYTPARGIHGYYFPYKNQPNYRSPFLMVQLDVPQTSRHTLINVECRAWARNIHYDRQSRLGSTHFEILVD
jgi:sodium/potassium-transporting ATPase subunit beta